MSDNSNIQNSLFETMKIFSESATANSGATITVEGVITAIIDEAAGIYTVEYLGSAFNIHTNSNATYSVGDSVYVLVPDGDFTKEKVILGLISASASVYTSDVENGVSYYEVSDNLIDRDPGTIKMSSYRTIAQGANKTNITNYDTTTFSNLMKGYLENYRTFKLSLSAKTALELAQQSKGNYGVSLSIPIKENAATGQGATAQSWKTVYLDVGNFSGTPYRYTAWAPQEVYFTIDEQYTYDSSRVPYYSYYCYDFTQDSTKTNIYDIQLKDISLKVVNAMTTDETSGYTLFLKATQGEYFSTYYSNIKTITPTLKVNGKTTSLKSSAIYWFVEDAAVKADSPDYISYGGYGWKCLNTKTNVGYNDDGTQTFDYITTVQTRDINRSEVKAATRFKCVVIYKDKEISSIITLKNLTVAQSIQLTSSKNLSTQGGTTTIAAAADNTYIKDTGYVDLSAIVYYAGVTNTDKNRNKILYTWARYDKDGNFINDANDFFVVTANNKMTTIDGKLCYVTQVRYPVNKLEELNTVYCTARYVYTDSSYNTSEEQIGTAQLGVVTNTQYNLNLTINGDNICYKYDSDGDSPMGTAYDGPTTSKVTSITPLTFVVTKADGTELTADEYRYVHYKWTMPKASLFTVDSSTPATKTDDNYYYFEGYGNSLNLLYKIASRFNMSKSKAGLNLTIDFQGSTIEKSAAITFIKEGMSGSNGTAYSAILVSGGISASDAKSVGYGILNSQGVAQKLKFCYNSSNGTLYRHDYENNTLVNWSTNNKCIYPQVWRDSSLLSYRNGDYSIEYSMFDSATTNPCFAVTQQSDGSCIISLVSTPNKDSCNIVQAKITVNDGNTSSANAKQIIYTYYPLELTITNFTPKMIPSMDGGFAEVMYASDGTNPSYDETSNFVINDDKVVQSDLPDTASYFSITWDASSHLGIYDVNADGTTTGTKRSTKATPTVKIKPDNKYDDGNSKNFIRATLSFNSSKKTELNNKRNNASTAIASAQNAIIEENDNYNYINNVISRYNSCVDNWYSRLNQIKALLARQTNAMYAIEKLQDELIEKTQEYIKYQEQYSDKAAELKRQLVHLEQEMNVLNKQCTLAANKLKTLNGTTGYKTSDLISLEKYKIKISETEQELWKTNLGRETAEMLMISVDQMNEEIVHYQKQYDMLQQSIYNTQLQTYNQIRIDLENIANQIGGNAFSYYAELRNLIYAACKSFDGGVSYEYLSSQLEWLENIFCSFANANSNHKLILIQSITDEYRQNIASYNNIITENQQTINCIDAILSTSGYTIYHIRPVVLYFNRYEMSNLNAWDGNKTEVNDGYILTPQVGAGTKESDNSFTGVVMGLKKISSSSTRKGLYGYHFGTQSFVLDAENGSAIFGKSKTGQIVIDPSSSNSLLYSSNYWINYNNNTGLPSNYNSSNQSGKGMCLDLKNSTIHLGSATSGKIYSGSHSSRDNTDDGFYVSKDGLSIGNGFKIIADGTATATHTGSNLGHWGVTDTGLISNDANGILLDSTNSTIHLIGATGKIYSASHATFADNNHTGFYLANDGLSLVSQWQRADGSTQISRLEMSTTGDPKIYSNGRTTLSSSRPGFYLAQDGLSICGTYVSGGKTYTSRLELNTAGEPLIYSGKHNKLDSTGVGFYIGSNGLSIGSSIRINSADNGSVYVGNLKSGNKYWSISGDTDKAYILYGTRGSSNSVYLATNELTIGSKFYVNASDGSLRLGDSAVAGTSGGKYWTIDANSSRAYIAYGGDTQYSDASSDNDNTAKVYLGTDGLTIGKRFSVSDKGELKAYSGTIGGWSLSKTTISSLTNGSGITLTSGGSISGGKNDVNNGYYTWSITSAGKATFNHITANNGGSIGGWTIGANSLTSEADNNNSNNKITIAANGSISAPNWSISRSGVASFSRVTISTANDGNKSTIGGINILQGGGLQSEGYSDTESSRKGYNISSTGSATFNEVTVRGTISSSNATITGGSITITNGQTGTEKVTYFSASSSGCTVNGNITAQSLTIKNDITAAGFKIMTDSSHYIEFGAVSSNTHPTVSGLNVNSGGIAMSGYGISKCGNIGGGSDGSSAVWTFHGKTGDTANTITTGGNVKITGTTTCSGNLKIANSTSMIVPSSDDANRTLSTYVNDVAKLVATSCYVTINGTKYSVKHD